MEIGGYAAPARGRGEGWLVFIATENREEMGKPEIVSQTSQTKSSVVEL